MERKQISEAELYAILEAQGVPQKHCAFKCVGCGHVQSFASFERYMPLEDTYKYAYFSCEGRVDKSRGCDWTLGGLFQIHKLEIVAEGGEIVPCFEPATPEEAKALMAELEGEA